MTASTRSPSTCKDGAISWACCDAYGTSGYTPAVCNVTSCTSTTNARDPVIPKCDEVTKFDVTSTSPTVDLQLHDGQFSGNVAAATVQCGGSSGACAAGISGVCRATVSTAGCKCIGSNCDDGAPVVGSGCTGCDAICTASGATTATVCRPAQGLCDEPELCVANTMAGTGFVCADDGPRKSSSFVCNPSTGPCDPEETCTGNSIDVDCPTNIFKDANFVCNPSTGPCDPEETCTGNSGPCPTNVFKDANFVCNPSTGPCDPEETCTGNSGPCPTNVFKDANFVCNPSTGPCDPEETCTGNSGPCPTNVFKDANFVCNPSTGPCDPEETCTSNSGPCPANVFEPIGTVCKPKADACDVVEVCDGVNAACPPDARHDYGYHIKCALVCYLCGVNSANVTASQNGNTSFIGGTNLGACDSFVIMDYPACTTHCLNKDCPGTAYNIPVRGLSNFAFYQCNNTSGGWALGAGWPDKVNVNSTTTLPVCLKPWRL
ncbi:hypothetical protein FOA52_013808 [Chlamydomonas sp. UWO 241]|nr:hypothetical protein FOA52_013808 [Chlamydomonas sp. UWO 241]